MDIVDLDSLWHVTNQLGGIKFVVRSRSLDDLGLFLNSEILVGVSWVNVLRVQVEDLVVGDDTRVGEVVDTGQTLLSHTQRKWQHFGQNGHGVWDVDNLFVLDNLGYEVSVK